MYNDQKILAIIPARGGSKGLPDKNIRPLLNKPLIGWTIESAKNSKYIDEICLSTDSKKIADIAEKFGLKVPKLRPQHLAEDNSSTVDVVDYLIKSYEDQNKNFDIIVLLEPTSPLRKDNDIDKAIEMLVENSKSDGVVSIGEVQTEHPTIVKKLDNNGHLIPYIENAKKIYQRQQTDKAYFPYGVVYIIKTDIFKQRKSFYTNNVIPYFIERWQNYEVDDLCDFLCIENILKARIEGIL